MGGCVQLAAAADWVGFLRERFLQRLDISTIDMAKFYGESNSRYQIRISGWIPD